VSRLKLRSEADVGATSHSPPQNANECQAEEWGTHSNSTKPTRRHAFVFFEFAAPSIKKIENTIFKTITSLLRKETLVEQALDECHEMLALDWDMYRAATESLRRTDAAAFDLDIRDADKLEAGQLEPKVASIETRITDLFQRTAHAFKSGDEDSLRHNSRFKFRRELPKASGLH
jgi:hypothetical protein